MTKHWEQLMGERVYLGLWLQRFRLHGGKNLVVARSSMAVGARWELTRWTIRKKQSADRKWGTTSHKERPPPVRSHILNLPKEHHQLSEHQVSCDWNCGRCFPLKPPPAICFVEVLWLRENMSFLSQSGTQTYFCFLLFLTPWDSFLSLYHLNKHYPSLKLP